MDTEKPGPFAVSVFVPGCGGNITKPPVPPQALERSARPSICLKHGHSLTRPGGPFTSASAEHDGRIYLDLADDRWRAVEIGPDGWQVITCPPVRFRRAAGMLPLPMPMRGGSIEALTSFFNLPTRSDFVLVVAWLLAALRHGGPYPLLAVSGEQGSAKTVLSKILRALIDPNAAPVRTAPREERDLFIAAGNGHLLAFDNLSDLPAWISDALCRLASGGSFAVRQLYTDRDEVLFQAARPTRRPPAISGNRCFGWFLAGRTAMAGAGNPSDRPNSRQSYQKASPSGSRRFDGSPHGHAVVPSSSNASISIFPRLVQYRRSALSTHSSRACASPAGASVCS